MKKNKIVIIVLILGILFLTSYLYNSYATSTGVSLGNDENTYDILLNDSTDTVSVPAKSSKTVYYQFSNTNKGTIKYHIGYTSDNVIAKVWWDTEDSIFGTIEYGEYKFIKLKLINDTTSDDTITIKPVLGYVNGGDVIPDSNTTLVTGTINETNTMSIAPSTALTTLGIDKANVKELSFVDDNIVPNGVLGSTNMNDDSTIKLWYTNSDTSGLYNVYIGSDNGITSFPSNSSSLFRDYTKMTSINLKNISTFNVTNMQQMFLNCKALIKLDLCNFDTKNIGTLYGMFQGCSSLISLNISSFNTSNVTSMISTFRNCSSLVNLDISNFDTSRVNNMQYAFYNCTSLSSLDLSSFDTSKVNNMQYMFYNCKNLTLLNVSSFDTSRVENMYSMFCGCQNLVSLIVSNFNTAKVSNMHNMFSGCKKLKSLDLSGFNTAKVTDMHGMFSGCESLISLDLSSFDTSIVATMTGMFSGCIHLIDVTFGNNFKLTSIIEDKTADSYEGVPEMFINDTTLSNDTINSILDILTTAGDGLKTKTLVEIGFKSTQRDTATTLSNYQKFLDNGWTAV